MSGCSSAKQRCLKNGKDVSASYRERGERVRQAREKHDEERMKKIDHIKQASLARQGYIGLEEERKLRIDEVRTRRNERQRAVLERRRQTLEAKMDQREALLRRKLERVAKLEAEKNAQRNAMRFAFGSVLTPRLDESYGLSNSQSTVNLVLPVNVNTTPTSQRSNRNFNGTYRTSTQPSPDCQHVTLTNSLSVSPCRQQPDLLTGDDGSQDNARKECVVCYDNPIDSVRYTCGHMCMCHHCAMQMWLGEVAGNCPICCAVIHDVFLLLKFSNTLSTTF